MLHPQNLLRPSRNFLLNLKNGIILHKPYDSGSLRKKVLKTAALRAKIQGLVGWHTLRHGYRAWLDETGAPLGVQQKLMRHANISTTMNVYGGAFMEAERKANTSVVQRAAGTASRPHPIAKGRQLDGLSLWCFKSYWTISDHNRKSKFLVTS
jgi:hypothetical protein